MKQCFKIGAGHFGRPSPSFTLVMPQCIPIFLKRSKDTVRYRKLPPVLSDCTCYNGFIGKHVRAKQIQLQVRAMKFAAMASPLQAAQATRRINLHKSSPTVPRFHEVRAEHGYWKVLPAQVVNGPITTLKGQKALNTNGGLADSRWPLVIDFFSPMRWRSIVGHPSLHKLSCCFVLSVVVSLSCYHTRCVVVFVCMHLGSLQSRQHVWFRCVLLLVFCDVGPFWPQIVQQHGRLPVDLFGIMLAM